MSGDPQDPRDPPTSGPTPSPIRAAAADVGRAVGGEIVRWVRAFAMGAVGGAIVGAGAGFFALGVDALVPGLLAGGALGLLLTGGVMYLVADAGLFG